MNRKGFTLIELLVVIAIIGILSSIVLVSVNSARNKAKDTAIKGALDQIRIAGEMAYDTAGNYLAICNGSGAFGTTGDVANISANLTTNGATNIVCNVVSTTGTAYAAQASLVTSTSTYYCVDSTGFSGTRTTALGSATVCPAN